MRIASPSSGARSDYSTDGTEQFAGCGHRRTDPADLGPPPASARGSPVYPVRGGLPLVHVYVANGGFGGIQLALSHGVPVVAADRTAQKVQAAIQAAGRQENPVGRSGTGGIGIHIELLPGRTQGWRPTLLWDSYEVDCRPFRQRCGTQVAGSFVMQVTETRAACNSQFQAAISKLVRLQDGPLETDVA